MRGPITLRALTHDDVEAHNAGEDEPVVRWLTGFTSHTDKHSDGILVTMRLYVLDV